MPKNNSMAYEKCAKSAEAKRREGGCIPLLVNLVELEGLASKKSKIYSRLLTEAELADDMGALASRHEQRMNDLKMLLGEECRESDCAEEDEEN